MAFTAEDGTGIADANSLVSIADADDYFTLHRSAATWSGKSTPQKQAALIEATAWVEVHYAASWRGTIKTSAQGCAWPRTSAYDDENRLLTGVPKAVTAAVCELALASIDAPLDAVQDRDKRVKSRRVGPISTDYDTEAPSGRVYPKVTALLATVSDRRSGSIKLLRG